MEPSQATPISNSVDPIDDKNETNMIEDEVEDAEQDEFHMLEDNIQHRDFTDVLVGKKLKAFYENGWFNGEIK